MRFRSALFSVGYAFLTFIISTLVMLLFWMLPTKGRFYLYALWCKLVVWWLQVTCGISYEIIGEENIPDKPVIALSNHQSTWETIFLYQLLTPVCPILKKELLSIPFWGWALRLQKPIAIDRSKPREAGKSLLIQGADRLSKGISILVFPEGTRASAGKLGNFSRGGAQLASATETAILPILHNAGNCWPARQKHKSPGKITVVIGKPIPAAGKHSKELAAEFLGWVEENKSSVGIE